MMSYSERAALCINPTAKKLLNLMDAKKTNLALAADVTTSKELLELADLLGPEICLLKTHIDIIDDFDPTLPSKLQALGLKHQFLLFEDRKFADIGNTVKQQYRNGIFRISSWADIVNAHTIAGPGIIEGLKEVGLSQGSGLLLLAEMSSRGALTTPSYRDKTVEMAFAHPDFVIGFITQSKISSHPCHIHMAPGVHLSSNGDALGQHYNTPQTVIGEKGLDVMIVGRAIIQAADPKKEAARYRESGFNAYHVVTFQKLYGIRGRALC